MSFTISEQMWCLLCSFLNGILAGFVYDVLRVVRNLIFTGKSSVFICDFIFSLYFAFSSVLFSTAFSRGNTRYYIVFGELFGFFIIRFTWGRISLPIAAFIIRKIRRMLEKTQIKSKKTIKKVLQPVYKLLYNTNRKRMSFVKRRKS